MKKFKDHIEEEIFNHHIVQGTTEKGKVTHSGSLQQMQKTIRNWHKLPGKLGNSVLVKTRHDLKTGDDWKKHMHAEASMGGLPDDPLKRKKRKEEIMKTVSHPGYDAESKNEELSEAFWHIQIPGIPNPIFIESSSKSSIRKDLRSQLKPDVWKDVSIERITKPNMVKMYRRLAKEGPSSGEETEEGLREAFAKVLEKKKEKANNEEKREPRIRVEGIDVKNADMGDVVKDFQSSDAPQFKGKSKEKKREMAIAAKLNA